ncbi:MAG: radical SAM protein [Candidatus Sigynarchaeota archaeon]
MTMIRFLMVFPRFKYPTGDPPIGPVSLVSFLRKRLKTVEYKFFDATFNPSFNAIDRTFAEFKPDITGIYCSTLMYADALKIARMGKKWHSFVVIGGPHATVAPESLLKNESVDAVVIGEGEKPLLHLISAFPNETLMINHPSILTREKSLSNVPDAGNDIVENLDDLPIPAYDLLDMNQYVNNWFQMDIVSPDLRGTNILVSRGCPFSCSFCQPTLNKIFGKYIRYRSPKHVVAEIEFLKRAYKINAFILTDDTPTFDPKWMHAFVEELKEKKLDMVWGCNTRVGLLSKSLLIEMKDVGFRRVMVGIESGSQRVLDEIYHKGIKLRDVPGFVRMLKTEGTKVFAYFMLGAPTETRREIQMTINLAFSLPIDEATFSITTPLPGTYLEQKMLSDGFKISRRFVDYDYYSSLIYNQGLGHRTIRRFQREAFLKFYLHPYRWPLLIKMIRSIRGIKKTLLKLKRIIKI